MGKGEILYATRGSSCFIKLIGDIRYTAGLGFDSFIETLFKDTTCQDVFIDLTETQSIDSTNLGLLARIARLLRRQCGHVPTLFSSQDSINQLLRCMGFDEAFVLLFDNADEPAPDHFEHVPTERKDRQQMAVMMLEAHKTLMELNERNQAVFKNVVDMLSEELKDKRVNPE
jgi:anti-anti-sigma factor